MVFSQCKAQSENITDQSKSTIEVRADIAEKKTKSKIELEKTYNESVRFLDSIGNSDAENYKSFLIDSQNGWEIYCEGKCKIIEYQSRDGAQGGLPFYNICITEQNDMRTTELKNWMAEWKREFEDD